MLSIARYLGQKVPERLADYATGTYLSILAIEYQKLSKRYVPELMNFCLNILCSLAPEKLADRPGFFPIHDPPSGIRMRNCQKISLRKPTLGDCRPSDIMTSADAKSLKVSLLSTTTAVLKAAAETWSGKPAFYETFQPALLVLQHLTSPSCRPHLSADAQASTAQATAFLSRTLRLSHVSRRPLELHHHRPLAIRTHVPKFEETFDPSKHYDPDRERAELAKLRAEHRRERKGAMRELRKDANFLARENLRRKKERDDAYDRKYRRLVAEIQSEEGKAANEYEREKTARKKAGKRG
jgi:nucleolar protein 14